MRDLLHRCDSVRRHSYTFADSSYAWSVFAVVPSAIRSRLRCMVQLQATGILAWFDATGRAFGNRSKLSNGPNNKSPESKDSTNSQRLNKQTVMKKPFILCCITLLAIAPVYFSQGKPAKAGKSAANESTITDLEKSAWEAYNSKQSVAFNVLMWMAYDGVYTYG